MWVTFINSVMFVLRVCTNALSTYNVNSTKILSTLKSFQEPSTLEVISVVWMGRYSLID